MLTSQRNRERDERWMRFKQASLDTYFEYTDHGFDGDYATDRVLEQVPAPADMTHWEWWEHLRSLPGSSW